MKVWIVTEEYNQYDQYGEYFLGVFKDKPTENQLKDLGIPEIQIPFTLKGGGKEKFEDIWYNLREKEI